MGAGAPKGQSVGHNLASDTSCILKAGGDQEPADPNLGPLADNGVVWLLTPKAGRPGHVEPSEINESAPTAGLQQTSTVNAGKDWTAARLVAPRAARSRR